MENRFLITAAALGVLASPASAARFLDAKDLTYVFSGREITGEYSNHVAFTETYHGNGTISYHEGQTRVTGRWKIDGSKFCTDYDGLPGGCFNVVASSRNCFEYWLLDAAGKVAATSWIARGWQSKYQSTCETK